MSRICCILLLSVCAALPLCAARNMIGRQSQNEGMLAVPAPGKVSIDGDLQEWDWSSRIWIFADTAVRDRYSVEVNAMWDKEFLYLAAKWKDPLPLNSLIDPAFSPEEGWKEDAWQIRVATADQTMWITTWYFATKKQPVMHLAYWKQQDDSNKGLNTVVLVAPPGGVAVGQGAELAYRPTADGKGFTQEMRIPWALLCKTVPKVKAGLTFKLGNELLWGDPTGKTWPIHRYCDNMQPGVTSREFYWTARNAWGDLTLVDKGHVPVREYISDTGRIAGSVPVRAVIPAAARRFTLIIEDARGRRIRSLAGDCDPLDYTVKGAEKPGQRTVQVLWDCLDDHGAMAPPGSYRVRGLTHQGLGAEYEMCFYNPGTPPWSTRDGRGAWGADHTSPVAVATGGDWTVVSFPGAEGGMGIIGIDSTGQKRWGDRRGVTALAADAHYVYAYVTSWYTDEALVRYELKTGAVTPFVLDGKERPVDLSVKELLGQDAAEKITALAVHGDTLALAVAGKAPDSHEAALILLDATSAKVRLRLPCARIDGLAFTADGALYGLLGNSICRLNPASSTNALATQAVVTLADTVRPVGLATDIEGNLLVTDNGPDSQVKAFSPAGNPVYTCGKRGGRSIRGSFDPQGLTRHMSALAVDARGQVWVVEQWNYPRRVSVWGRDGKLVRDYLGNTGYAGANCYLHDQDASLAYCGPLEFKLDKATRKATLTNIMWVPDPAQGESFALDTGGNSLPQRCTSAASGKPHEYLYTHENVLWGGTGNVVFMQRNGGWQPVAAICLVGHISGSTKYGGALDVPPSGEWAGLNAYDGVVWNDLNHDGKVQRSECTIVLTGKPNTAQSGGQPAFSIDNGWGGRLGDDLSIYTSGITRWKPQRYTDDGAPIYSLDSRYPLAPDTGDLAPVPGEKSLIALSWVGYAGPTKLTAVDTERGAVQWYYPNPYPGVHGSHDATMPKPGMLIGPLKTMGTAHLSDDIGTVFAMRGNLGQDFFMTTDGLFVGALFQDCRLPGDNLPDSEAALLGMPMEGYSEGGEPFNGWFGKQNDGKVRLTTGMAREAGMILRITGLETIKRFTAGTLTVDMPTLARANADNIARQAKAAAPKTCVVKATAAPMVVNADAGKWQAMPAITVAREGMPERATVKLAYDATTLYAIFQVEDASPWCNEGKDFARLFKTGDAVDIQLAGIPGNKAGRDPQPGDQRLVIAPYAGHTTVVRMVAVDASAPRALARNYTTGWTKHFDRVEIVQTAQTAQKVEGNRYTVEVAIPLQAIGLALKPGLTLRGDVGFISSNAAGLIDTARTYWSNKATNLVNDLPLEAWFSPEAWGTLTFE